MPEKRIKYGGVTHSFPDTFTDSDIGSALSDWDSQQSALATPDNSPRARREKFLAGGLGAQFSNVQSGSTTTAPPPSKPTTAPNNLAPERAIGRGLASVPGAFLPVDSNLNFRIPPVLDAFIPIAPQDPKNPRGVVESLRIPPIVDAFNPIGPATPATMARPEQRLRVPPIAKPFTTAIQLMNPFADIPSDEEINASTEGLTSLAAGAALPKVIQKTVPAVKALAGVANPVNKRLESLGKIWPDALKMRPGLTNDSGALLPGESPSSFTGTEPMQFLREAARNLGIRSENIAVRGGIEDLNLGTSKVMYDAVRKNLGKEALGPVQKALADEAVTIADQPIRTVVETFGDNMAKSEQAQIVNRLRQEAAFERAGNNVGKAGALERYADAVEATDGTVRGIDSIKIEANRRMADAKKNPTAQARADESPIAAHEDVGSIIREVMYPSLERMAGIENGRLIRAGFAEHNTMKLRDAIYENYDNLVASGQPNLLQRGAQAAEAYLMPRRAIVRNITTKPANSPQTMAEFNKTLQKAISKLDTDAPIAPLELRPAASTRTPFTPTQPSGVLEGLGAGRPTAPGIEGRQVVGAGQPQQTGTLGQLSEPRMSPQPPVNRPPIAPTELHQARPVQSRFLDQLSGHEAPDVTPAYTSPQYLEGLLRGLEELLGERKLGQIKKPKGKKK